MEKDRHAISSFRTFFIRTEIFYWPLEIYLFKRRTSNSATHVRCLNVKTCYLSNFVTGCGAPKGT